LNLTYIREDLSNYSISEYLLSLTSKNTRQSYASNLYKFFRHIYPDQIKGRRLRGRKGEEFAIMVDQLSLEYVSKPRRFKEEINQYRDSISNYAPKSRIAILTSVFSFREYNNISFTSKYKKGIYGKEKEAISEEFVPNNADINKICEFFTLPDRIITLLPSSSGMRVDETGQKTLDMLDLDARAVVYKLNT